MTEISFLSAQIAITLGWILCRLLVAFGQKGINWKREAQLLLVYICIQVVARVTFFPFAKVDGAVQPLIFDAANALNFRINFLPLVNLLDYEIRREALINVIGNTALFIPMGIVWPSVYKKLDTHWKVIAAGVGFSLTVEILQLPFYDRVTDIDDLLLNSLGFLAGYGLYLLGKALAKRCKKGTGETL